MRHEGNRVWSMLWRDGALPSGLMGLFWPADKTGDARAHMRWDPPAVHLLDVGITEVGEAPEDGLTLPSVHLLSPETAGTTHYFWAFLRNRDIDNAAISDRIRAIGVNAFANEDKPIIEAQQANIDGDDLFALQPIVLAPDAAAMRARRMLKRLIDAEAAASPSRGA
jgi:Vanillate O-demethylase oxygenase C-terminal domain